MPIDRSNENNPVPADDALARSLDALGAELRSEVPAGMQARIESAVQGELDRVAPMPLLLEQNRSGSRLIRWGSGLAVAAAVTVVGAIVLNQQATPTTAPGPVATGGEAATEVLTEAEVEFVQGSSSEDLGNWLASLNLSEDDSIDGLLQSGRDSGGFWDVDEVLQSDESVF